MIDNQINDIDTSKMSVDEYKKLMTIGATFIETIDRFSKLYRHINNIEYSPRV